MLTVIPVGGFSEIGRNCVVIRYDKEMVMLDLGLEMENYVAYTQDEEFARVKESELINIEAAPDLSTIPEDAEMKAICISHAHLDHVGAVEFLAHHFNCRVYGSNFTIEVLKGILKDNRESIPNKLVAKPANSRFKVSDNIEVEFIYITHSTPETVCIAVHTPGGTVLYANDFKLDGSPTLGPMTNTKRLKEMKVKCLIMDSLYAPSKDKCLSESIAKEKLREVLLGENNSDKRVLVTTFSSHIARLKSIVEFSKQMKREPVFLGRSIQKYVEAAKRANVIDLTKEVNIMKSGKAMITWLKGHKDLSKYLIICTGHQGEQKAVLSRLVDGDFFHFNPEDKVIFSCMVIPTPTCVENRKVLDKKLEDNHVTMLKNVHVSGHAHREDHREMVELTRPEHIIPTHGDANMLEAQRVFLKEIGYSDDKIHILKNGQTVDLS